MITSHGSHHSDAVYRKNLVKRVSLLLVGGITVLFIIAEIVVFIRSKSLVVLADAISNIFDLASVGVAYWAIANSVKSASAPMTFGWKRTEIVGATINASALTAVCLFIFLNAIPNFISAKELDVDIIYLIVAATGILVHGFGVVMILLAMKFAHTIVRRHVESSYTPESPQTDVENLESGPQSDSEPEYGSAMMENVVDDFASTATTTSSSDDETTSADETTIPKKRHHHRSFWSDLNMKAVFASYAADTIGSILVLSTGLLVFFYSPRKWTSYLDPTASVVIAAILLYLAIPLVKSCAKVLLHRCPDAVPIETLHQELLNIAYVAEVHDLHVWQLNDHLIVGSVHLPVVDGGEADSILNDARSVFHSHNIHSSTIQLEYHAAPPYFVPSAELALPSESDAPSMPLVNGKHCPQNCIAECKEDWCCRGIRRS